MFYISFVGRACSTSRSFFQSLYKERFDVQLEYYQAREQAYMLLGLVKRSMRPEWDATTITKNENEYEQARPTKDI